MQPFPVHPNCYKKVFFSSSIRMSRKNINFGLKEIKKSDFYKNKKVTQTDDINANKILVSKKELYDTKKLFKYFIGYYA